MLDKATQQKVTEYVQYDELLGIIEGYVVGSPLALCLVIKSDSLLAIDCLSLDRDDLPELGALAAHFFNGIDSARVTFSHVYRRIFWPTF